MKLSFQSTSVPEVHIKIQEYQVKRHQAALIISSSLTKSYHPIYLLPLHAKVETVHYRAPIIERSITFFQLCIILHWDMTPLLVTVHLVYIRFANGDVKAAHLILNVWLPGQQIKEIYQCKDLRTCFNKLCMFPPLTVPSASA